MSYALFAREKLSLDMQLNMAQLQQTMASNTQYALATNTLSLNQQLSSMQVGQSNQLAVLYQELAHTTDTSRRDQIDADIRTLQAQFDQELEEINREIYKVSVAENAIEMTVKRLDTQVTALQKQLEAVEQAESSAIDRATPKFAGLG